MKITKGQLKIVVQNALNEQYGDRYSHDTTAPLERYTAENRVIGEISATVGDDYRYRQTMRVFYHPADDSVTVELTETGAIGGSDYEGPGSGASEEIVSGLWNSGPGARPVVVVTAIRDMITRSGNTIARYGKPTKNFRWPQGYQVKPLIGLSARIIKTVLDRHRA